MVVQVALNMTFPETVTPHNYDRLRQLVEIGPHPPPGQTGAKSIVRDDGQRLDLRFLKKEEDRHIEVGYKVRARGHVHASRPPAWLDCTTQQCMQLSGTSEGGMVVG